MVEFELEMPIRSKHYLILKGQIHELPEAVKAVQQAIIDLQDMTENEGEKA
jgi:cell division ATPase FtsA